MFRLAPGAGRDKLHSFPKKHAKRRECRMLGEGARCLLPPLKGASAAPISSPGMRSQLHGLSLSTCANAVGPKSPDFFR